MKVLVIDDSPESLKIAQVRLAKEGLEVVCSETAGEGLDLAHREQPDLILLDIQMPEMSGFDVCRQLKADPQTCMIPVIFLASSENTADKVRGLDLGAVDYVTKPFDGFELRARVRAALRTKHLQDLLIQYAQIDPLTELWNRRALTERLGQEWARIQRSGGSLAFIMADLDRFKQINDKHGHHVGDQVLREVARLVADGCRQSDLPARYGGEEFAVLLPDQDADAAACLAERCRCRIEQSFTDRDGPTPNVTASFGVSDSTEADSPDALLRCADVALYEAKSAGRNCVRRTPHPAAVLNAPNAP